MCVHTIITKAKTNKREKNDEFVEHLELCARYALCIVYCSIGTMVKEEDGDGIEATAKMKSYENV